MDKELAEGHHMTGHSRRNVLALIAAGAALGACGRIRESRFNPFNWFGRDREERVEVADQAEVDDARLLVREVLSLNVDQTPEGAIVRTIGLPPTQGFWDAELVEVETEDSSALTFEFRVFPPLERRQSGTQQSREIIAGIDVSNRRLETVRSITVIGQGNRRSVRR